MSEKSLLIWSIIEARHREPMQAAKMLEEAASLARNAKLLDEEKTLRSIGAALQLTPMRIGDVR